MQSTYAKPVQLRPTNSWRMAHAGLKTWAKVGNLQFPPEKRYAVLQEIVRHCAEECRLACCFTQADRLGRIADGWTPPTFATPALAQDSPRAATVMGGRTSAPLICKRYPPRSGGWRMEWGKFSI
jgi:hypothetical protein